ncbi:hypothetical protein BC940DRAFT_334445 [Gongronella butleri]|nr:hypothetical protein BC940DRAFT_334445 [Gongronella butleri]
MTTQRLLSWQRSPFRHLCLDTRPSAEFLQHHLWPSVNIPVDQLNKRMAELPPRNQPFALVTDDSADRDVAVDWLADHGWHPVMIFRPALEPRFWAEVDALYRDKKQNCDQKDDFAGPALLFQPHAVLSDFLPLLRDTLHAGNTEANSEVHVLDVGCGSGRDVMWLLAHQPNWHAAGVDTRDSARERFGLMTQQLENHEKRVCFVQTKVGKTIEGLPRQQYDLVLMLRCLLRPFMDGALPTLVRPGGLFVISQFVDQGVYTQPRQAQRLRIDEVDQWAQRANFNILVSRIETIEDGRPVHSAILQRASAPPS